MSNKNIYKILLILTWVLIICGVIVFFVTKKDSNPSANNGNLVTNSGTNDETNDNQENNDKTDSSDKDDVVLNEALTTEKIEMKDLIASVKLGDYSKIEITATKDEVTEEDIMKEIESFLSYYSSYEHLTEGTVKDGQTVNIDYVGKLNGTAFDGGSAQNYNLKIGSNTFIDGFEDGLIDAEIGKTVDLVLTFPTDYKVADLAGKEVVFEVKINYALGEEVKAELTDEFLSKNTDYKTVEALRKDVTDYLTLQADNAYEVARENEVLDYLIANSEIPKIPTTYTDEYIKNMKDYYVSYAEYYNITFEEFLSGYLDMTEKEFDADCLKAAINYMQSTILLDAIATKENITLSDADFDKYVEDFAKTNGYESKDELLKNLEENNETEDMKKEALYHKVMNTLFENIVVIEPSIKEK